MVEFLGWGTIIIVLVTIFLLVMGCVYFGRKLYDYLETKRER